MKNKKTILVLQGLSRNGLAVMRSLSGTYDLETLERTSNGVQDKIMQTLKSRHVKKVHFMAQSDCAEDDLQALVSLLRRRAFDFLLPTGTYFTNLVSQHKATLGQHTCVLAEEYERLWPLHNKATCMDIATRLGIPVPKTYHIRSLPDLRTAAADIDFPVIFKGLDSWGSNGIHSTDATGEELVRQYLALCPEIEQHDGTDYPIIQQRIQGPLEDTTAFALQGKTVAVLSQRRDVMAWLDGGGGIVNVTTDVPSIKEHTRSILRHIQWTGPIEMDWIRDPATDKYYLIEINPKFWGTTQLTISAGYDMPKWLLDWHDRGTAPAAVPEHRVGLMYRWLIDEMQVVCSAWPDRDRFARELRGFARRWLHRPQHIDLRLTDPGPFLAQAAELALRFPAKRMLAKLVRPLTPASK